MAKIAKKRENGDGYVEKNLMVIMTVLLLVNILTQIH